jgi:hypothetical protein
MRLPGWFQTYILAHIVFTLAIGSSFAQSNLIKGQIIDDKTREPLAFVHIIVNNSRSGTTSGINGRFSFNIRNSIHTISLSYVGYISQSIDVNEYLVNHPDQDIQNLTFRMERETRVLNEVVFEAGENPAHPIIRKAVENRKINNPEKIKSFQYKSYNKFYVDAENMGEDEEFTDFISKRYLFMMESVTERKYIRPDRSKETIIANRVSGFKNPLFTTLANSFQPFSFYGDYISVAGKNYLNPVSKGSTRKYFFSLEDSIYSGPNKVYIISFEPGKKNMDGLKGVLYINTYKYGIENVIAETANLVEHLSDNVALEMDAEDETIEDEEEILAEVDSTDTNSNEFEEVSITFKIQQKYELIDQEFWFPSQLNTDILIGDASGRSDAALKGIGRSYLSEIELLAELRKREFDRLALEFDPKANKRDSLFWSKYRVEPLSDRGKETYHFIDSVGDEANLDRIVTGMAMLTTGKIRMGKLNWDINEFLKINRYEGVRLGAGLHTNKSLSTFFNVGGYGGYGFRDKAFKYGGDVNIFLTEKNEISLFALYQNDITEFAGTTFYLDNNPLSSERNRKFMIDNMDIYENKEAGLSFYFLKYLDMRASFSKNTKEPTQGYSYAPPSSEIPILYNFFQFAELKLAFKYSFREKYVEVLGNKVSVGTKYPVIWVNYTRGFDDVSGGNFNYEKWDLKIHKSFLIRGIGKPSITLKAGMAAGNVPATNLYNGNGSKIWQIPLEAANSFNTMEMNEFLSDRFAALYYTHSLGRIKINPRRSTPEFLLVTNIGWGELQHPERHQNIEYKTMEKGYYESGLSIRDLYKSSGIVGLGIAGFYRYGPYARGRQIDNIAIKLTFNVSF